LECSGKSKGKKGRGRRIRYGYRGRSTERGGESAKEGDIREKKEGS